MKTAINRSTPIRIVTHALAALGVFSSSLVSELGAAYVFLAATALALSGFFNITRRDVLIPHRAWTVFALLLFAYFIADYMAISQSLLGAAARFLTVLAAIKLFDLQTDRDYLALYGLVFFQILAAAASTVSPVFFAVISVFIICSIWAMMLFNIKGEFLVEHPDATELPRGVLNASFFIFTVLLSMAALVMTLALFFTIPRIGIGLLPKKTLDTVKVSGFSERVELGAIGPVKNDPTIVMRVTLPNGETLSRPLYFRGQSLDKYDGTAWSREEREKRRMEQRGQGLFVVTGYEKNMLEQRILLEPLETDLLFAADRPNGVAGSFTHLWTDGAGAIHLYSPPYSRIEYTAFSTIDGAGRKNEAAPTEASLDASTASEATKNLATGIVADADDDAEKAALLSKYLTENYRYTLSPRATMGVAPLDDFLFNTKEGYCEHYATALAIMLRAVGVPARLATGFVRGEWNAYGNYYVVRQQDAHSWVEAYVDGSWTSFDPTPQTGLAAPPASTPVSLFMDSLRYKWMRYIVRYTLSDQLKAARSVEGGLASYMQSIRESFGLMAFEAKTRQKKGFNPLATAAIVAVIMTAACVVIYLAARGKHVKGTGAIPKYYLDMTAALKKKGLLRRESETPLEFALRTGLKEAMLITNVYNAERFGGRRPTPAELDKISESLAQIAAFKT